MKPNRTNGEGDAPVDDFAATSADDADGVQPMVFDRDVLLDRCAGDEEFLAEFVELFIRTSRTRFTELQAAVAKGDAAAVCQAAHTLRGSAATAGATAVYELASELEETGQTGELTHAESATNRLASALEDLCTALARTVKDK